MDPATTALTIAPTAAGFAILPAALEARETALAEASLVGAIETDEQNAAAVEVQKMLARLEKDTEAARKALKEPILDAGRKLDAAAKGYLDPVKAEALRIAALVGDFMAEKQEQARRAEQARQAELRRLQEEREAEIRKAEQAAAEDERLRLAALAMAQQEAEAAAKNARTADELRAAQHRAQEAQAEAARKAREAAAALEAAKEKADSNLAQEAEAVGPATKAAKAAGQSVRTVLRFEVVDIHKLYRIAPWLVRLEPNRQEINEELARMAQNAPDGTPIMQGLRVWRETAAGVRLTPTAKAIDV